MRGSPHVHFLILRHKLVQAAAAARRVGVQALDGGSFGNGSTLPQARVPCGDGGFPGPNAQAGRLVGNRST